MSWFERQQLKREQREILTRLGWVTNETNPTMAAELRARLSEIEAELKEGGR
jgi:hypothetical protein